MKNENDFIVGDMSERAKMLLEGKNYHIHEIFIFNSYFLAFCFNLNGRGFPESFHCCSTLDQLYNFITEKATLGGGHPDRGDIYVEPNWDIKNYNAWEIIEDKTLVDILRESDIKKLQKKI